MRLLAKYWSSPCRCVLYPVCFSLTDFLCIYQYALRRSGSELRQEKGSSRGLALSSSSTDLPGAENGLHDILHPVIVSDAGEQCGSRVPHFGSITLHHVQ